MRESGWGWDAFLRISRCRLKCATFDRSALSRTCRSSMDAPSAAPRATANALRCVRSGWDGDGDGLSHTRWCRKHGKAARRGRNEAHALRVSRRIHDDGLGHGLRLYSRACGRGQSPTTQDERAGGGRMHSTARRHEGTLRTWPESAACLQNRPLDDCSRADHASVSNCRVRHLSVKDTTSVQA